MIRNNYNQLLISKKIMGCWLGKAVGGTLGQPYEGVLGPLNLDFYDPVPNDMIPNDDLDLQVLWACILDKMERPVVDRQVFGKAWLEHVNFPWDEYGVCIRNMRNGIMPPFSGSHDNWFANGMGAAIRSELWACIAPGNPKLAATYAYEDACIDHAGEGIYAEMFLAAMESEAFINDSIDACIKTGLDAIPSHSLMHQALVKTYNWALACEDSFAVRQMILDKYQNENFTDAVMNIPLFLLSVIHGKGDFSKTICLAVNFGRDADCTTASAGAFLGIINPDGIEDRWLKPIGRNLVINKGVVGIEPPSTLDGFTEMVIDLQRRIGEKKPPECQAVMPDVSPVQFDAETWTAPFIALDNKLQFEHAPKPIGKTSKVRFTTYLNKIDVGALKKDQVKMFRFTFELPEEIELGVMLNTPSSSWVWVDGDFLFAREHGRMAPSFHRCPVNQRVFVNMKAGKHYMSVGLMPLGNEKKIEFNIGLGNASDKQWLINPFLTFEY